ncbi:MAG: hypothetical protein AW07_00854 [Candidatus Accumulibacter sp. SK-11]|nr:MAG: hypothetical protein AW07_00854 [Candidatus Accumulibacter sp. SK-11]
MPERCDDHQFVVDQRIGLQLQVFRRIDHHVEVVLIGPHAGDDVVAIGNLEFDMHVRMATTEVTYQPRQEVLRRRHQRDAQPTAFQALEIRDGCLEARPHVIQRPRHLQRFLAGLGQYERPTCLLEQRQTNAFGDLSHLQGNRRLCQMKLFGCFRKASVASDGGEALELAESDSASRHA